MDNRQFYIKEFDNNYYFNFKSEYRFFKFIEVYVRTRIFDMKELKKWHKMSGLPLKRFFNTSGMKYKELGLKDRIPQMTEEEQYELLATDGMLVKRPILVGDTFAFPGFREKEWKDLIG